MGLALAYKRGEVSDDEISPEAKAMADKMSEKDLEDFAKTKHKGLPVKKEEAEQVDEGPDYLGDIRRKKERDEKKKASQHAGETQRQKMMRKVYGKAMGGLKKEEVELDEASDKYMVKYTGPDKSGKTSGPFSKAAAEKKAAMGNKADKVGGKYEVLRYVESVDLDEGRGDALKAFESLVKRGGIDRATFQKAYDLYKATKFNELKKLIRNADTDVSEAIADLIQRHDSKAFNSMYPKAKSGDYLRNIVKEKMDPVDKKALKKDFDDRNDKDIDNDGDVDGSDEYLHNRRKAVNKSMSKDKKDKKAEISKIDESFEELWTAISEAMEPANRRKNATAPEGLVDKESPKSKEFIAKHEVQVTDEEPTHDTATAAGRATKPAAARPGDNKSGDKNIVNPIKTPAQTMREKIMDVLSGKTWKEIKDEANKEK